MININIKVTNAEEFMQLIPLLKEHNIKLEHDNKYNCAKHTIIREQQRQQKIIELLEINNKMTSLEIFKKIKSKDKCMYKSIIRDLCILYKNGVIDYNKHSSHQKFGNVYEVKLKCCK